MWCFLGKMLYVHSACKLLDVKPGKNVTRVPAIHSHPIQEGGRLSVLMVSVLYSGLSGLGTSPYCATLRQVYKMGFSCFMLET